ncbi:MAG: hypothetical protein RR144_01830 [Clostridia bacterium]
MKKSFIIILIILFIFIFLLCGYFFFNRTIKLIDNSKFNKVYSLNQNIENIEISILDYDGKHITNITDKKDISIIINTIKDEKLKNNIKLGDEKLGKAYHFLIKNIANNNTVNINICGDQMSVNNKTYSIEHNLVEKLNEVYSKYHTITK